MFRHLGVIQTRGSHLGKPFSQRNPTQSPWRVSSMLAVEVEPTQVTATELASFTRQLGAMLDAGVNVLRALRIASQHTGNSALVEVARDVARRLEDGREFYQAIAPHPETFSPFFVEMARQG